jgi:lysophospholipase L1-like esterase
VKKIAFSLVVALAVLEPVARLWVYMDPLSTVRASMMGDPDTDLLYRPRPGARVERTDSVVERYTSLGTRGPEPDMGQRRVLVIGDSVTHGFRLREEDTYPRQVERLLGGVTVVNAGVCGYQPWNERARLRQLAPTVRPDVVVIQWCQNDKWRGLESLAAPELSLRTSALIDSVQLSPVGLISAARYVSVLRSIGRVRADLEANPPPLRWEGEWQDAYLDLALEARRSGRRAVALIMPSQRTVEGDAAQSDPDPEALARMAGLEIVDPLAALRAEGGDLWVDPIHPSARGMAVVARELAAAL